MNLPNKITIFRIIFIPAFIVLLFVKVKYAEYIAAAVFIFLACTDALDGYLARKNKQITNMGKLIDPIADKLLISAALIFLIGRGVPAWIAFVIIAREFAVTGLRLSLTSKGIVVAASKWGKVKTISQMIGIVSVIINFQYSLYLMILAALFTVISGIGYFIKARHHLKDEGK